MLSSLLAISWEPGLRGVIVVITMIVVLIGGTYLIVGTNLGARLGFLVILSGLFGWMFLMGAIWWTYGIGLKGPEPSWKPAEPITIVRDARFLTDAGVIDSSLSLDGNAEANASTVSEQLQAEGWVLLDEADPQRGQAIAASDALIQNEAEEFAAGEYLSLNVYDRGGSRPSGATAHGARSCTGSTSGRQRATASVRLHGEGSRRQAAARDLHHDRLSHRLPHFVLAAPPS
jgi:hypothetical protein